jgi:hypothetical protein
MGQLYSDDNLFSYPRSGPASRSTTLSSGLSSSQVWAAMRPKEPGMIDQHGYA